MAKIIIPNPATILLHGSPRGIKVWRESRKVKVPGSEYTPAAKYHGWDGFKRPGKAHYDQKTGIYRLKLDRGWLPDLMECFPDAEIVVEYDRQCDFDLNKIKAREDGVWEMFYDYQRGSLEKIAANRWGRIALATNAGKGAIIALGAWAALPSKTLILADEVAVFDALCEEVEKWAEIEPGKVESGCDVPPTDDVVVAMVPTLRERLKDEDRNDIWYRFLESFRVAFLDEADKATSDSWEMVCDGLINTEYRAGFSGSFPDPGTINDFVLLGRLGETLIRVKNQVLVERGISAKPRVQLLRYTVPRIPPFEWPPEALEDETPSGPALRRWAYRWAVLENEERHRLVRALLHPEALNVVIVNRLDHGEALAERIEDSIFLSGSDSKEYRQDTLNRFENKEFQHLIVTNILDRGSNKLKHAVGLVFASAEGSPRQTLQRIGRGLRRGDGKEFIFLRDIIDQGNSYLEKAALKRLSVYKKENFDIEFLDYPEI